MSVDCGAVPERTRVRVRVALASLPAEGICGLALRVEVPAGVDAGDVHRLLLVHPDADLLVDVGEEIAQADAARRWIDQLASATPRPGGATRGSAGGRDGGPP